MRDLQIFLISKAEMVILEIQIRMDIATKGQEAMLKGDYGKIHKSTMKKATRLYEKRMKDLQYQLDLMNKMIDDIKKDPERATYDYFIIQRYYDKYVGIQHWNW